MRLNHFLGGIFLVAGTTVGAGMLALPVMTSFIGFFPSLVVFFVTWLVMLATSFFFLDVNLSIEGEVNFITMSGKTLGLGGKVVNWIFYLLLLYSLTAAYIAGSAPIFIEAIEVISGFTIPTFASYFCLPVLFGFFVYSGTLGVDLINRILMFGLIISYILLIGFLPSHIEPQLLMHVDWAPAPVSLLVVVTSFGYHIIIPSLTTYMKHDRKHLRWTLLIGSVIPLAIYVVWQLLTLGVLPLSTLAEAWSQGTGATGPLIAVAKSTWVKVGVRFFAFFAIVTSFLGVSLSLADFLTDGLKIKKTWEGRLGAILLTFVPPLIFLFSYQRGFIIALEYAGAIVAILLILLPALMAWQLKTPRFYRTPLGRGLLTLVILFAFGIIAIDVAQQAGVFQPLLEKYVPHH